MARQTSPHLTSPRLASEASTHLRAVDPLDVDLLEALEERDRSLYAIMSAATRYRAILHEQLQLLRAGKHPEVVRSAVGRWHGILGEIKSLAEDL
jgi:hypothetical protein